MSARPMRKKSALTGGAAAVIAPAAPVPPAAPAPGAARAAAVERLTVRVPSHLMERCGRRGGRRRRPRACGR